MPANEAPAAAPNGGERGFARGARLEPDPDPVGGREQGSAVTKDPAGPDDLGVAIERGERSGVPEFDRMAFRDRHRDQGIVLAGHVQPKGRIEVAVGGEAASGAGVHPGAEPNGHVSEVAMDHRRKLTYSGRFSSSERIHVDGLPVAATLELRRRADRDASRLGVRPGSLTAVTGLGDPHLGGRRVARVRFGDRLTLIYKPRPVAAEVVWNRVVRWLGRFAPTGPFLTPWVLSRARYGWVEDLVPRRPATAAEERLLSRRAGTLLALFDVLEVRDTHRANLIVVGDQLVLVDAETVAHPRLAAFRNIPSVALTGFLPAPGGDRRRSGLAAVGAGYDELIGGYREGLRILRLHHAGLLGERGPLCGLAKIQVRVVLRPTAAYAAAIGGTRLDWPPTDLPPLPIVRRGHRAVEEAERRALLGGDVPVFHCAAGGVDLLGDESVIVPAAFPTNGIAAIRRRLARLSIAEERRSVELLSSALVLDGLSRGLGTAARRR